MPKPDPAYRLKNSRLQDKQSYYKTRNTATRPMGNRVPIGSSSKSLLLHCNWTGMNYK